MDLKLNTDHIKATQTAALTCSAIPKGKKESSILGGLFNMVKSLMVITIIGLAIYASKGLIPSFIRCFYAIYHHFFPRFY
jgi:hypothetical protein